MENNERERPYICMKCGWRSFNYPNVHTCSNEWPVTMEQWEAKDAAEIANDPRMAEWIRYTTRKYSS